jgi:hypothetical protein
VNGDPCDVSSVAARKRIELSCLKATTAGKRFAAVSDAARLA